MDMFQEFKFVLVMYNMTIIDYRLRDSYWEGGFGFGFWPIGLGDAHEI